MSRQKLGSTGVTLLVVLACVVWLAVAGPAEAQGIAGNAQVNRIQAELKAQRLRADGLRAEMKRQQRAVGELRKQVTGRDAVDLARAQELHRLGRVVDAQRGWLLVCAAFTALLALVVMTRRPAAQPTGPALAMARQRNQRLRDEMTALDARVRAAERGTIQSAE